VSAPGCSSFCRKNQNRPEHGCSLVVGAPHQHGRSSAPPLSLQEATVPRRTSIAPFCFEVSLHRGPIPSAKCFAMFRPVVWGCFRNAPARRPRLRTQRIVAGPQNTGDNTNSPRSVATWLGARRRELGPAPHRRVRVKDKCKSPVVGDATIQSWRRSKPEVRQRLLFRMNSIAFVHTPPPSIPPSLARPPPRLLRAECRPRDVQSQGGWPGRQNLPKGERPPPQVMSSTEGPPRGRRKSRQRRRHPVACRQPPHIASP